MLGLASLRCGTVNFAAGVDEPTSRLSLAGLGLFGRRSILHFRLEGVQNCAAGITLVSSGTLIVADGALALDKAIGKEALMGLYWAKRLDRLVLLDVAILIELCKDVLDNLGLVRGRGLVEDVKLDAEPVVDGLVEGVVLGTEGGRVDTLFESFGLGRGTVLILE